MYWVNGLVYDTLTKEYVTPERWEMNNEMYYMESEDENDGTDI